MKRILCMPLAMLLLLSLCACGQSAAPTADNTAPPEAETQETAETSIEKAPDVVYSVTVADTGDKPIQGAMIQFCDETSCRTGYTDADGAVTFTAEEGTYTLHVVEVPLGIVATDEEFTFPNGGSEARITLESLTPADEEPKAGFAFYDPEKYEALNGAVAWDDYQVNYFVYVFSPVYVAAAKDDPHYKELWNKVVAGKSVNHEAETLFLVICVMKDESEAEAYLRENISCRGGWDAYGLEKIGSAEKMTCFLAQPPISEEELKPYKSAMGELYDEFADLRGDKETFRSGIKLSAPVPWSLFYEMSDLDGNPVDLADVYAGHKVTMVNVWTTGCVPCIEEMPGLQKLNESFEELGCQIIGVCTDCHPGDDASKVKSILEKAGVTYLNLLTPGSFDLEYSITSNPTSFFVDSEGRILTEPVPYAYIDVENYRPRLEEALSRLEE